MNTATIYIGDCLDVLKVLPEASFDGCLCDPPYGLSFMGRAWDHGVPSADVWRAVYRVLKPGAMLLAFGSPRTFHRLACAIEDAEFEIRDTLMFLYGSGFPKSLAIDKAIDRMRDDKTAKWAVADFLRLHVERVGFYVVTRHFGFKDETMARARWTSRSQTNTPTWEQWLALKELCGFGDEMDAEVWRLNGRKGQPGEAWHECEVIGQKNRNGKPPQFMWGEEDGQNWDITAPATDESKRWQDYGTSLKPSYEPLILAQKTLDGTYAQNAIRHGVAGLNVDGCRIPTAETDDYGRSAARADGVVNKGNGTFKHGLKSTKEAADYASRLGRWPANVILGCACEGDTHEDSCAVRMLDEQSGESRSNDVTRQRTTPKMLGVVNDDGWQPTGATEVGYGDSGGASRFFYTSKVSTAERQMGLPQGMKNRHPTLKPIDLCAYLAKLILPPAREDAPRRLLVPFCGTGSEIIGAFRAGWEEAVGIDNCADDECTVEVASYRIRGDNPLFNHVEIIDHQRSAA